MGTKYSSQSISGYNSSPPPDDGTTVSANKVTWAVTKTKLADPLNTFTAAVNSALVTALDYSATTTAVNYTTVAGDNQKTIQVTGTTTLSLGDAASMAVGYSVPVFNSGTNTVTVTVITGTDTLNGVAGGSITLAAKQGAIFAVNQAANGYNILAQFLGSTQTGTGNIVFATSPTISAPTISGHPTIEAVTSTGATGTGKFVFDTSPALVTPALGTPASGNLANCTGYPSIVLGTPVATTSGTVVNYTGLPSGIKRIVVSFNTVSVSNVTPSGLIIQIGEAGSGISNSGYVSSFIPLGTTSTILISTTSFLVFGTNQFVATSEVNGSLTLSLENSSSNSWVATGIFSDQVGNYNVMFGSGVKSLPGVLDRIRITTVNGTDTFDKGEVNISYQT